MKNAVMALASFASFAIGVPASATTTDFSNGAEGWIGNAVVDTSLGNSAPSFHTFAESFGISWRNESNAAFLGDYSRGPGVTLSLDVLTNSITYLGNEVTRGLFVKLTDLDPSNSADNATVYYKLGTLSAGIEGWQTLSVTIDNTSAAAFPVGWGGVNGDGVLSLPAGRTFASVLANVDLIEFTTFEPDYFYGFTIFDVAGDNFSVTSLTGAVPEPATWVMMIGGFGMVGGAMRRRRISAKVNLA